MFNRIFNRFSNYHGQFLRKPENMDRRYKTGKINFYAGRCFGIGRTKYEIGNGTDEK
jgi:hypothetical protein